MPTSPLTFTPVTEQDADALATIRVAAMRESLERAGRFDETRARQRFYGQFKPADTYSINLAGERIGFYCLTQEDTAFYLQNLYLLPGHSGQGLGAQVLQHVLAKAAAQGLPVRLEVLRGSDAQRFYERHGFVKTHEEEWDIHFLRPHA